MPAEPATRWWSAPWLRVGVYAVALCWLGGWVCFHHIDRGMLIDDESAFGITTDVMLETGDWVVPSIGNPKPHLNATPLYNWLCCLTADLAGDNPLRYRAWSAVFAVLCVLAMLLLGTDLFRPEVGFLAGVLLLTNRHFVFGHGARSGVMEPGLMLFLTMMTYCYLRTARPGANALRWWALVGVSLGGAVMMKPPAMGGFFFILIGLHHLFARRDLSLAARFTRPLLALGVAGLIAFPWYAALYQRLGAESLKALFYDNSVGRIVQDANSRYVPPLWSVYLEFVWGSGTAAKLFWPAVGVGAVCALLSWLRSGWWLPTLLAATYTLAISLSTIKNPHYVYCAFPFLCILAAAVLLVGWLPRPKSLGDGRLAVWGWRSLAILGAVAAGWLIRGDVREVRLMLRAPTWEYPPLMVYRAAEAELDAGRADFVLFGEYPRCRERTNVKMGFGSVDRFYRPRLARAEQLTTVEELNRTLANGLPIIVFLPPKQPLNDLAPRGLTVKPDRALRLRTERSYYRVLLFHGAEARFGLTEFLRVNEVPPDEPDRF